MVLLDLGVPPGFVVDPTAFERMVEKGRLERFKITARQVILYFGRFRPDQTVKFSYELIAKYPIRAKTPRSIIYEYYTPDNCAVAAPVELEVTE
jgi:hypothetical protein